MIRTTDIFGSLSGSRIKTSPNATYARPPSPSCDESITAGSAARLCVTTVLGSPSGGYARSAGYVGAQRSGTTKRPLSDHPQTTARSTHENERRRTRLTQHGYDFLFNKTNVAACSQLASQICICCLSRAQSLIGSGLWRPYRVAMVFYLTRQGVHLSFPFWFLRVPHVVPHLLAPKRK